MSSELEKLSLNGKEALVAASKLILKYKDILEDKQSGCKTFASWVSFDPAVEEDWLRIIQDIKKESLES